MGFAHLGEKEQGPCCQCGAGHWVSNYPSSIPSSEPSIVPSVSLVPSSEPSTIPSSLPSNIPSLSAMPSLAPSSEPSTCEDDPDWEVTYSGLQWKCSNITTTLNCNTITAVDANGFTNKDACCECGIFKWFACLVLCSFKTLRFS